MLVNPIDSSPRSPDCPPPAIPPIGYLPARQFPPATNELPRASHPAPTPTVGDVIAISPLTLAQQGARPFVATGGGPGRPLPALHGVGTAHELGLGAKPASVPALEAQRPTAAALTTPDRGTALLFLTQGDMSMP